MTGTEKNKSSRAAHQFGPNSVCNGQSLQHVNKFVHVLLAGWGAYGPPGNFEILLF